MAENLGFGFGVREEVKEASGIKIRIYGSGVEIGCLGFGT
jgi:hypothetical protein